MSRTRLSLVGCIMALAANACANPTKNDAGGFAIDVTLRAMTGARSGDTVIVRFGNAGNMAAYVRPWCYTTEKLGDNGWERDTALTVGCPSLPLPEMVPVGSTLEHTIVWHPAAKRPEARTGTFRVVYDFQTESYVGGNHLSVMTPTFRVD